MESNLQGLIYMNISSWKIHELILWNNQIKNSSGVFELKNSSGVFELVFFM